MNHYYVKYVLYQYQFICDCLEYFEIYLNSYRYIEIQNLYRYHDLYECFSFSYYSQLLKN